MDEETTLRMAESYKDIAKEVEKIARILSVRTGISFEDAVRYLLRASDGYQGGIEVGEFLDITTAWNRKEMREKKGAAERAAVHNFFQYKVKENAWAVRKRTGRRRREWRGPWKER